MTAKKSGAKKCCDAPAATASACDYLCNMFSLVGKKAVVTGGGGVLGTDMACALARAGAQVLPKSLESLRQIFPQVLLSSM